MRAAHDVKRHASLVQITLMHIVHIVFDLITVILTAE